MRAMMNHTTPAGYDPTRKIRLMAVSAIFVRGQRIEPGTIFEVQAKEADEILHTNRAKFADELDRGLVYKKVKVF